MGKKKGSGKLAKMTEEERMLYLEQQRMAEEEMRKKKEDMLVVYLKVRLHLLVLHTLRTLANELSHCFKRTF